MSNEAILRILLGPNKITVTFWTHPINLYT